VPEPRRHRRVTTPPVPGTDPEPQRRDEVVRAGEDAEESWGDRAAGNDDRLRADVPPHWG
jgi:high-mobility group nucleosome-binding domain-containing protein 2